jgi:hypothetical protein
VGKFRCRHPPTEVGASPQSFFVENCSAFELATSVPWRQQVLTSNAGDLSAHKVGVRLVLMTTVRTG